MPFKFLSEYQQDIRSASYVPMPSEELLEMAHSLVNDQVTGAILRDVGVHGDITEELQELVSNHVIEAAEKHGWERPDPGNLLIPVALARQIAAGSIDQSDTQSMKAFIEDRRCEGVNPIRMIGKPARVSELIPFLDALEHREDLKAPYNEVRNRTLDPGEKFFPHKTAGKYRAGLYFFIGQQRFKYALRNRVNAPFDDIASLLDLYADKTIDRLNGPEAIDYLVSLNKRKNHLIDDR